MSDIVAAARGSLGRIGVQLPSLGFSEIPSVEAQRNAVQRLERVGWRAAFNNEGVGGREAFVQLAVLLAATERMTFGSSISNIWARPPQTAHAAASTLTDAYPGRFVFGLGPGYPFQAAQVGREYGRPLSMMREYAAQMAAPQPLLEVAPIRYARIIAANGPKMMALAGEVFDGALPTVVPPSFTAQARAALGADKLLVVGLLTIVDDDDDRARATARSTVGGIAAAPASPYAANLLRLGYTAAELAEPAARLIDDVVAFGSPARIEAAARTHLAAGADHVVIMPVATDYANGIDILERLGSALDVSSW